MERLSGLDASFLYLETPSLHMHVAMTLVFDPSTVPGGYSFERMKESIADRIPCAPVFRRRLVEVPFRLGHPVWVDDPDFDIDYHVRRAAVPEPGGLRELADLAGDIAGHQLDRSKPLWEMWIVEGLADGRIGIIAKMHHSTVDGVSGAALLSVLFDLQAEPEPGDAPPDDTSGRSDPVGTRTDGPGRGGPDPSTARDRPGHRPDRPPAAQRAQDPARNREADGSGQGGTSPVRAPNLVQRRRHAAPQRVTHRHRAGRRQAAEERHRDHGERRGPGRLCRRAAPVPGRGRRAPRQAAGGGGAGVGPAGDGVAQGIQPGVVDVRPAALRPPRPLERLNAIHQGTKEAKEEHNALGPDMLQNWAEHATPNVFASAARLYTGMRLADRHRPIANLVISNVPGPDFPLYLGGAELTAGFPLGPVMDGMGVNITIMSYRGVLNWGILACPESIPRLWNLTAAIPLALDELLHAAGEPPVAYRSEDGGGRGAGGGYRRGAPWLLRSSDRALRPASGRRRDRHRRGARAHRDGPPERLRSGLKGDHRVEPVHDEGACSTRSEHDVGRVRGAR